MRGLACKQIEVDEIWGFVGAKQKNAKRAGAFGDVWTFIALDADKDCFMANLFDQEPLEITCPNCRNKIQQTVAWFKKGDVRCPSCDSPIDTTHFRRELEAAEKAAADFLRQFGQG